MFLTLITERRTKMTVFNFHTNDGNKDVQINSPEHQFNFSKEDEIIYEGNSFIIESIEYHVSENKVDQVVTCVLNV